MAPITQRQAASGKKGALFQDRTSGNGSAEQGRQLKQENGKRNARGLLPVGARLRKQRSRKGRGRRRLAALGEG